MELSNNSAIISIEEYDALRKAKKDLENFNGNEELNKMKEEKLMLRTELSRIRDAYYPVHPGIATSVAMSAFLSALASTLWSDHSFLPIAALAFIFTVCTMTAAYKK